METKVNYAALTLHVSVFQLTLVSRGNDNLRTEITWRTTTRVFRNI